MAQCKQLCLKCAIRLNAVSKMSDLANSLIEMFDPNNSDTEVGTEQQAVEKVAEIYSIKRLLAAMSSGAAAQPQQPTDGALLDVVKYMLISEEERLSELEQHLAALNELFSSIGGQNHPLAEVFAMMQKASQKPDLESGDNGGRSTGTPQSFEEFMASLKYIQDGDATILHFSREYADGANDEDDFEEVSEGDNLEIAGTGNHQHPFENIR